MGKIEIGKNYKVIKTPEGLVSSGGVGQGYCNFSNYVVNVTSNYNKKCDGRYYVTLISENGNSVCSYGNGWLYDYEMVLFITTTETIKNEIIELKSDIETINADVQILEDKLSFMESIGVESFDEEEFKAYQVLKVLGIDDFEKAKQITKILSK